MSVRASIRCEKSTSPLRDDRGQGVSRIRLEFFFLVCVWLFQWLGRHTVTTICALIVCLLVLFLCLAQGLDRDESENGIRQPTIPPGRFGGSGARAQCRFLDGRGYCRDD